MINGKKLGLVGKVLVIGTGIAAIFGCQTAEHRATARRMLAFGLGVGSNNPNLTQQQAAAGRYAEQAMNDANRDEAIRNSGGTVIINGGLNQSGTPLLYIVEIYNLDNGKKEIEMIDKIYLDYFLYKKDLASKYRIIEKKGGIVLDDCVVEARIEKREDGEYNSFYKNGKWYGACPRELIKK